MGKRKGDATAKQDRPAIDHIPKAEGDSKFARALGSTAFHTREKGVQALASWLRCRTEISEADLAKIWKGLFYCYWHSDKHPVQRDLADRLAGMLPQLKEKVALAYFQMFFRTMRREWSGIDRLRLDKFLMMIRKFTRALLLYLRQHGWSGKVAAPYLQFLQEQVLVPPAGPQRCLGIATHLADVWVEELAEEAEEKPPSHKQLLQLLRPFINAMARSDTLVLTHRIRDGVFEALCKAAASAGPGGAMGKLRLGELAESIFECGAQTSVLKRNRQVMYALSQALEAAGSSPSTAATEKPAVAEASAAAAMDADDAVPTAAAEEKQGRKRRLVTPVAAASATAAADVAPAEYSAKRVRGQQLEPEERPHRSRKPGAASASGGVQNGVAVPGTATASPGESAATSAARGRKAQAGRSSGTAGDIAGASSAEAVSLPPSIGKKTLSWNLAKNVYSEIGGPVPPSEIRTPPPARPKGSCLKTSKCAETPKTAPPKASAKSGGKARKRATRSSASSVTLNLEGGVGDTTPSPKANGHLPKSPRSVPRAKAAEFFDS